MPEIISLPPVLERYELKYVIPWSYVEPITAFISAYCDMDAYSIKSKADNYFYKVAACTLTPPVTSFYNNA